MINPKNIGICSCVGFFLSFFIGLISGVHFSHVLLRACLFALVFAVLCVGITFIYQKFLSEDNGGFSVDSDAVSQKSPGGVVNIVVDDTNLADDGLSPKFTVMHRHAPVNPKSSPQPVSSESEQSVSDVEDFVPEPVDEPVSTPSASEDSFRPVSLAEGTSSEAVKASPVSAPVQPQGGAEDAQLDELPDIGSMGIAEASEGGDSSVDSSDEIVRDTEFATGGAKMKEQPISGDTNVMAKAIQTLLAQDNN